MIGNETSKRKKFMHQGSVVYEWEENLDSILVFIEPPPIPDHIKLKNVLEIGFKPHSISIGIKGNPPYLNHQTKGIIDCDQSVWYVSENPNDKKKKEITLQIQKAQKAMNWGAVFKGHQNLNPLQQEQLKKKMMLERFQQQHPNFDFSSADFNGQIPDARSFMGGMKDQ